MKIDALIDFAYDRTIEHINTIEDTARRNIYQSIVVIKGKLESYVFAYANYYCGCFEEILFTCFLEEFNRMPTATENAFIVDSIKTRFEDLKKICIDLGEKKFKEDN